MEDLGLPRTNFGVVFRDQGPLQASSHFWHHQVVVNMPKLDDIIPAGCIKYIDERNTSKQNATEKSCRPYMFGIDHMLGHFMVNMNMQLIEEFRKLSSTVLTSLPRLSHPDRRSRARKHPHRIPELSKSLHSTAEKDVLERIARKINALIARGQNINETFLSREKNFESYVQVNNHRIADLKNIISENHNSFDQISNETWHVVEEMKAFKHLQLEMMRRLNATNNLVLQLRELDQSIQAMARGEFPQSFRTVKQIRQAARAIHRVLRKKFPNYSLLHSEPEYFHRHGSFVAQIDNNSDIWITLKFPIGLSATASKLYRIDTYPVPVSQVSSDATSITGLPEYVVIRNTVDDQVEYASKTHGQVTECSYKDTRFACQFDLKFIDINEDSCLASLLVDDSAKIHSFCEFLYFRGHIKAGFVPLTGSLLLLYNVDKLTLMCGNGQIYTETGCHFCAFHVPCNCEVTYHHTRYATSGDVACVNVKSQVTRHHLVNLAIIKEFNIDLYNGMKASTSLELPSKASIPQIKFYDNYFKQFIARDDNVGYSLKKIAQAAKEDHMIFETLSEAILMGKLTVPFSFSWLIIVCVISIVFSITSIVAMGIHVRVNRRRIRCNEDLKNQLDMLEAWLHFSRNGAEVKETTKPPFEISVYD